MNAANCAELIRLQRLHAEGNPCHARSAQRTRKVERKRLRVRLAGELDGIAMRANAIDQLNQVPTNSEGVPPPI